MVSQLSNNKAACTVDATAAAGNATCVRAQARDGYSVLQREMKENECARGVLVSNSTPSFSHSPLPSTLLDSNPIQYLNITPRLGFLSCSQCVAPFLLDTLLHSFCTRNAAMGSTSFSIAAIWARISAWWTWLALALRPRARRASASASSCSRTVELTREEFAVQRPF